MVPVVYSGLIFAACPKENPGSAEVLGSGTRVVWLTRRHLSSQAGSPCRDSDQMSVDSQGVGKGVTSEETSYSRLPPSSPGNQRLWPQLSPISGVEGSTADLLHRGRLSVRL